jgi:hypothetical protein
MGAGIHAMSPTTPGAQLEAAVSRAHWARGLGGTRTPDTRITFRASHTTESPAHSSLPDAGGGTRTPDTRIMMAPKRLGAGLRRADYRQVWSGLAGSDLQGRGHGSGHDSHAHRLGAREPVAMARCEDAMGRDTAPPIWALEPPCEVLRPRRSRVLETGGSPHRRLATTRVQPRG